MRYVAVCRVGRPDVPCSFVLFGDGECCDSCHSITENRFSADGINVRLPNVYDFESGEDSGDFVNGRFLDWRVVFRLSAVSGVLCRRILVNAGKHVGFVFSVFLWMRMRFG